MLSGPRESNLALREFPNVRVVATQAASWDRVIGQNLTETLVPAHPNVKMIMAQQLAPLVLEL